MEDSASRLALTPCSGCASRLAPRAPHRAPRRQPWLYIACFVLAPVLMYMTDTLYIDSGVGAEDEAEEVPCFGSPLRVHAKAVVRSLFALLGQVMLWCGAGLQLTRTSGWAGMRTATRALFLVCRECA